MWGEVGADRVCSFTWMEGIGGGKGGGAWGDE